MVYFAKLEDNTVIGMAVLVDVAIADSDGILQEQIGIDYLRNLYNEPSAEWIRAYKYGGPRKNYPGIGFSFDSVRDAFIHLKPYPSWVLNEDTCQWNAPTAMPSDDKRYTWDEPNTKWIEVSE
jgi:hypothetical protein